MFIIVLFASVAYLAIGFGFTMLSLHELATGRRDRLLNRLLAWSGVVLWLPTLLVVVAGAFLSLFGGHARRFPLQRLGRIPSLPNSAPSAGWFDRSDRG